jgi:hypothetical protein
MAKRTSEPPAHDPGEVVEVVSELMQADRARGEEPDLRAIGAELGVPGRYVDEAVVELDRRRARRRRGLALAAAAALVASGALVAWRAPHAGARPGAPAVAPDRSLRGLSVAFDLRHGLGSGAGKGELEARGATALVIDQALTDVSLKDVDVLVLLEARRSFEDAELDAVARHVREGHGLVVADLGWSWVMYEKKPLAALPANALGSRLGGFGFTNDAIGVPAHVDPAELGGIAAIARTTPWVSCGVALPAGQGRVLLRDEKLRPMAGALAVDKGHVAVFGHAGMLLENPALLAYGVALAAGR